MRKLFKEREKLFKGCEKSFKKWKILNPPINIHAQIVEVIAVRKSVIRNSSDKVSNDENSSKCITILERSRRNSLNIISLNDQLSKSWELLAKNCRNCSHISSISVHNYDVKVSLSFQVIARNLLKRVQTSRIVRRKIAAVVFLCDEGIFALNCWLIESVLSALSEIFKRHVKHFCDICEIFIEANVSFQQQIIQVCRVGDEKRVDNVDYVVANVESAKS